MPRLELIFLRSASGDGFDALQLLSVMRDWWTGYVQGPLFPGARCNEAAVVFWSHGTEDRRPAMTIVGQPLQEYDGRKTMRSLADALEKLREFGSDDGRAEIKTMELVLPDRRTMGLVAVLGGPCQRDGARWVIGCRRL
jgi:hypothetical protein